MILKHDALFIDKKIINSTHLQNVLNEIISAITHKRERERERERAKKSSSDFKGKWETTNHAIHNNKFDRDIL